MDITYVDLDGAAPADAVVVIDVLRAFTVVPWLFARGAARVLAVAEQERAEQLRATSRPRPLLAGEHDGRPIDGFDLGNSPSQVSTTDLSGQTVVHRTSAGTQGLVRTVGSRRVYAASFVTAAATAAALRADEAEEIMFVITGASFGRDGDEDLAAAELIAARVQGEDPDPELFLKRVPPSDAGQLFAEDGPEWAPPADMAMAMQVDRFDHAVRAEPITELGAVELAPTPKLAVS